MRSLGHCSGVDLEYLPNYCDCGSNEVPNALFEKARYSDDFCLLLTYV